MRSRGAAASSALVDAHGEQRQERVGVGELAPSALAELASPAADHRVPREDLVDAAGQPRGDRRPCALRAQRERAVSSARALVERAPISQPFWL